MITRSKIDRLKNLLRLHKTEKLKEGLYKFNDKTNKNYKLLFNSFAKQKYDGDNLIAGARGVVLEGSSRSGKTWSGVDFIIYICLYIETEGGATINIYRETYNEFKTTLYEDFKRRLQDFDLDNPFLRAKEVSSFKINGNTINFLGDGKHGGGCDYAFYNEVMFINNEVFDQSEMRCRKFWWMDYNPSFTDHWVFNRVIPRSDVEFLRTTLFDNPFISPQEKNKILGYEPWETDCYEIVNDEMYYNGEIISKSNQPPINIKNVDQGTANEFMWKVYGLGLRGAMEGVIFPQVTWIDKFPEDIDFNYSNDFGFKVDPNCLVKYSEDENNIYAEPLIYEPVETPELLSDYFNALDVDPYKPMSCDSSDRYTSENKGVIEMVKGLKENGYPEAFKISKKKSILYWLLSMSKKNIHIVRNSLYEKVKTEQQNYIFKEINGIKVNQPIDAYNHFWDAVRYGHMSWNEEKYEINW